MSSKKQDCPSKEISERKFSVIEGGLSRDVDPESIIPGKIIATFWGEGLTTIIIYRVGNRYYERTLFDTFPKTALATIEYLSKKGDGHAKIDEREIHRLHLAIAERAASQPPPA